MRSGENVVVNAKSTTSTSSASDASRGDALDVRQFESKTENSPTSAELISPLKPNLGLVPKAKELMEVVKDRIASQLKAKIHLENNIAVDNDDDAIRRAISHVIEEATEVVSWIPKTSNPATNETSVAETKSDSHNVILYYKNALFKTMNAATVRAGQDGYNSDRLFYQRADILNHKPKCPKLLYRKKSDSASSSGALDITTVYKGAKVIIPICIGFDGALTEKELKAVFEFCKKMEAAEIVVYIGEYNRLEDPVDQLDRIGKQKREAWLKTNEALIISNHVQVLLREQLIETQIYKDAKAFVESKLDSGILGVDVVMEDAQIYLDGRTKKSSPQIAAQVASLSAHPSATSIGSTMADDEFRQIEAVAAGITKDSKNSKDKAIIATQFLITYRALTARQYQFFPAHEPVEMSVAEKHVNKHAQPNHRK